MAKFSTLATLTLCAIVVSATPTPTTKVPIARKKLVVSDMKDFLAREQLRVVSFGAAATSNAKNSAHVNASAPAINGDVSYSVSTVVNGQTFNLIVDTGSSNTWVGAATKFNGTGATATGDLSVINYGSGSFVGEEYIASTTLGGLTVPSQLVGVAEVAEGFDPYDGIFGFGPVDLTENTIDGFATAPTFMDNLFAAGAIATEVLGVSFAPESGSDDDDDNGELTFGGIDHTKFSGTPTYVPVSTTSPYSTYWGVDTTGLTFGNTSLQGAASAIVDTGTTLIWVPLDAYNAFLTASGGETDETSGLPAWSTEPTEDLTFIIDGNPFPLTPAQYLVPKAQYINFGLENGTFYAWITTDGTNEAADLDFIIGQKFLEHYYSIFDTTNGQIGFAPSRDHKF